MEKEKTMLGLRETEQAIKFIKDTFSQELAKELNLFYVSAPLFVRSGTGINDDLNGIEKPVSFTVKSTGEIAEIVQSLAKWKRIALAKYGCVHGQGIFTDMRAIRPDEELDAIHSLYVDQWDWEKVLHASDRTIPYLKSQVKRIYNAIKTTEAAVTHRFPFLKIALPEDIYFIHTRELEAMFPKLSPKEREHEICRIHGAVFLIGIGGRLADGKPHDGRAPDYDDWSTEGDGGYEGLNGDILVWDHSRGTALELSSMGIRVDQKAMKKQLAIRSMEHKSTLPFHKLVLEDLIPLSMGGGIGQSRLCMYLLGKSHIGSVQASLWPQGTTEGTIPLIESLLT